MRFQRQPNDESRAFRTGIPNVSQIRKQHETSPGFTLIELLVVIAVMAVLLGILLPSLSSVRRTAQRLLCMNNIRQFVTADAMYLNDNKQFPAMSPYVPTSVSVARLRLVGNYFGLAVPPGEVGNWPKRPEQPKWINCPFARDSGYAEGLTVGGGLYTGYAYFGGLEQSDLVKNKLGTPARPSRAAEGRGMNRGVLWSDILTEFPSVEDRRYENFHVKRGTPRHPDFRFYSGEIEGIHRGWSDGSVEWVPKSRINLGGTSSPDLQLQTFLGNFYF